MRLKCDVIWLKYWEMSPDQIFILLKYYKNAEKQGSVRHGTLIDFTKTMVWLI